MTVTEMTVNAMFYIFFVALSGGLGVAAAFLIAYKLFTRMQIKAANKQAKLNKNTKGSWAQR